MFGIPAGTELERVFGWPSGQQRSRKVCYGQRRVFVEMLGVDKALEQVPAHGGCFIGGAGVSKVIVIFRRALKRRSSIREDGSYFERLESRSRRSVSFSLQSEIGWNNR